MALKSSRAESSQDQFYILGIQQVLNFCTGIWWFLILTESTFICVTFIFLEAKPRSWRKQVVGSKDIENQPCYSVSAFLSSSGSNSAVLYMWKCKFRRNSSKFDFWLSDPAEFSSYPVNSFKHLSAALPALCSSTPSYFSYCPWYLWSIHEWNNTVEGCTAQTGV